MNNLEKQEGTPVEIDVPKDLPYTVFNPPRILQPSPQSNYFGYTTPMIDLPNYESGSWTAVENKPNATETFGVLKGNNFIANGNEVYSLKNGVQGNRVSNASISIKSIEHRWSGKKIKTFFKIVVTFSDKEKSLKIPKENFKDGFEIIRKCFPEAYISKGDYNSKEEYLSEVYKNDSETAKVEHSSDIMGWVDAFENSPPKFYVGQDKFYERMEISIPIISGADRRETFVNDFGFLQIGHENDVIEILWINAHIAPLLFWLRKFGIDFRSVTFVKGKTNLFKTTVVVMQCALGFSQHREFCKPKLQIPIFIDAAATMAVVIDIIVEFGLYCGIGIETMQIYRNRAMFAVENVMKQNLGGSSKQAKPEVRFLYALMQSIGTSKFNGLAKNETEYIANI